MIAGFADAMQRVIDEPELAARMGSAAQAKLLAQFTWQMKIDRILEIYKSVIRSA
jgi:glycosyltransferase involved in cell wall biosynthesis